MRKHRNSKKFARMFLNTHKDAEKALSELALAGQLSQKSGAFKSMLSSPVFTPKERETALNAVAQSTGISDVTVRFLLYLCAEQSSWAIPDVLDKAIALHAERTSKVRATVISAVKMDSANEERIKKSISKMTGRQVEVQYTHDPALLGGVLVRVGSTMFDGSVKGQLRMLKEELIKG